MVAYTNNSISHVTVVCKLGYRMKTMSGCCFAAANVHFGTDHL